jgi:methyl-accepting chemotaxis protein
MEGPMGSWTIGRKLFSVVGVLVTLFAVTVALVYRGTRRIEVAAEATARAVLRLEELAELDLHAERLLFLEKAAIIASYSHDRRGFDERRHEVDEQLTDIKAATPNIRTTLLLEANRDDLKAFDSGLAEWERLFAEVARAADEGRPDEAQQLSKAKSRPLMERNVARLRAMEGRVKEQIARAETDDAGSRAALLLTIAFLFAVALVTAGFAVYVVRGIVSTLRDLTATLSEGAGQVTSAASQVAMSAQNLSQGATEQAASLEETSASMEEMTAMTRQNATHSHEAATLMAEVDRKVSQSNQALEAMVASMTNIQDSSTKVSKIIKAIDEIAFQTNILALNAAVEAARAGDAGMGFAVVADEVRNLAQRSAQAARDTACLIDESSTSAAQGAVKVEQVAVAIAEVTTTVGQVKALVEGISDASRQQAQGIDQVTQAVSQMERVTQTTAATAEESAGASEELNAQAEATMETVCAMAVLVDGRTAVRSLSARQTPDGSVRRRVFALAGRPNQAERSAASRAEQAIPFGETGTFGKF